MKTVTTQIADIPLDPLYLYQIKPNIGKTPDLTLLCLNKLSWTVSEPEPISQNEPNGSIVF